MIQVAGPTTGSETFRAVCVGRIPAKPVLRWHTKTVTPLRLQETLKEAKNKVEENTGLRPTNERLLKGIKALEVPPRLRDHMRCLLTGRLKCGPYWSNIPRHAEGFLLVLQEER